MEKPDHPQAHTAADEPQGNVPDTDLRIRRRGPGVQHGIADADKVARTGSKDEAVRNTPPAGAWNDVADD